MARSGTIACIHTPEGAVSQLFSFSSPKEYLPAFMAALGVSGLIEPRLARLRLLQRTL